MDLRKELRRVIIKHLDSSLDEIVDVIARYHLNQGVENRSRGKGKDGARKQANR